MCSPTGVAHSYVNVTTLLPTSPWRAVVILLPAFFIDIVQQVLVVLQLIVKWIFTAVLMYIFRWGSGAGARTACCLVSLSLLRPRGAVRTLQTYTHTRTHARPHAHTQAHAHAHALAWATRVF